ncbi:MAG: hypothetical protein BWY65_02319 [Firmicutes bacterium ADurb.Bin373]|nr:MAG: hypothetical protein BWY65_02319 [Firmicutes bacterium ADurb.Bin373]
MPKYVLRTVTMVRVGVDYSHPLGAAAAQVINHYCLIVDITKTTVPVDNTHRMMPGWPDQGKSVFNLAGKNFFRQQDCSAGRNQVRFGGLFPYPRYTKVCPGYIVFSSKGWSVFSNLRKIYNAFFKNLIPGVK